MEKIVKVQKEEKDAELKTSFLIQELWYLIYLHVEETKLEEKKEDFTSYQARLQLMMQYIHKHFGEKISLEDTKARVSKSTALNLFRRYLHSTLPVKISFAGICQPIGYNTEKSNGDRSKCWF